jgi:hypothetical protein
MFSKRTKPSSDTIKDTELGTLSFADYGDTASYSCSLTLAISSKNVAIFFDTNSKEHLPTENQRQFLKSITANYDNLIEKAIPVILSTVADSDLKEKTITKTQVQPVSLIIPQVDTGAFKWDMTFEVTSLKDTFIIVYFDQFTPLSSTLEKDERKPFTKFLLRLLNGRS